MNCIQEAAAERVAIQIDAGAYSKDREPEMIKFYLGYYKHKAGCTDAKYGRACATCKENEREQNEKLGRVAV